MSKVTLRGRSLFLAVAVVTAALVVAVGAAGRPAARPHNTFFVHNLTSDQPGLGDRTDPNLVNPWGLAATATSPWWVADNGTGVSTLYDSTGLPFPAGSALVVGVDDDPTGLVASTDSSFVVGTGASAGPSAFLFSTESGQILGWHGGLANAIVAVDMSSSGAVFKGLAIASDHLYATDFHNNRVDVFDSSFKPVSTPGAFTDPGLPKRFAPFGIQAIGGDIYVTYAKQDSDAHDDVDGAGLGFIDRYDTAGNLLGRVASRGALDAPWGLALAPDGFGRFGGDLIVGNFGDGTIHAYATDGSGKQGTLKTNTGMPVYIGGLWALQFGMGGANNGPTSTLFFTAGPSEELHGVFGMINS